MKLTVSRNIDGFFNIIDTISFKATSLDLVSNISKLKNKYNLCDDLHFHKLVHNLDNSGHVNCGNFNGEDDLILELD